MRWTLCATDRCFKHALLSPFFCAAKVRQFKKLPGGGCTLRAASSARCWRRSSAPQRCALRGQPIASGGLGTARAAFRVRVGSTLGSPWPSCWLARGACAERQLPMRSPSTRPHHLHTLPLSLSLQVLPVERGAGLSQFGMQLAQVGAALLRCFAVRCAPRAVLRALCVASALGSQPGRGHAAAGTLALCSPLGLPPRGAALLCPLQRPRSAEQALVRSSHAGAHWQVELPCAVPCLPSLLRCSRAWRRASGCTSFRRALAAATGVCSPSGKHSLRCSFSVCSQAALFWGARSVAVPACCRSAVSSCSLAC